MSVMSVPFLFMSNIEEWWINLVAFALNLSPIYFNYRRKYVWAKTLLIVPPLLLTLVCTLLFYSYSWLTLYMVIMQASSLIIISLVIFQQQEKKLLYFHLLSCVLAVPIYASLANLYPSSNNVADIRSFFVPIFVCFLLTVIVGIFFYRSLLRNYVQELFENQKQLKNYNEAIELQKKEFDLKNVSLESLNKQLSGTLNQNKDYLQIVLHDLKSPVNAIIGLTDILQSEKDLLKIRKYNDYILHSAQKALHLIENLRQVALLDSENIALNKEEFHLDKLVEEVVQQNKVNADKKGQKIVFELEEELPVLLDPLKIYQVVDNILNNAVKYAPKNTDIHVKLYKQSQMGILKIKDYGQGFTDEEKSMLFQKFSRTSSRPTGNESSSGLGLYICKKLVELQNGRIIVESEGKNKGSEFTVFLPMRTMS